MPITSKNWTFLLRLLKSISITETQMFSLSTTRISEWGNVILKIKRSRILPIFLWMITKAWIKWKKLNTSKLFCSIQGNSTMMIRLSLSPIKREPLFAFINQELALLEIGRGAKRCITLNFLFTKRMLFWPQPLSICHIKWFKLRKSKNSKQQISTKTAKEVTQIDKDAL